VALAQLPFQGLVCDCTVCAASLLYSTGDLVTTKQRGGFTCTSRAASFCSLKTIEEAAKILQGSKGQRECGAQIQMHFLLWAILFMDL